MTKRANTESPALRCSPARVESGPPYCMNCCGTGYARVSLDRYPYTDLIDCGTCGGTGRAKDHPQNAGGQHER